MLLLRYVCKDSHRTRERDREETETMTLYTLYALAFQRMRPLTMSHQIYVCLSVIPLHVTCALSCKLA